MMGYVQDNTVTTFPTPLFYLSILFFLFFLFFSFLSREGRGGWRGFGKLQAPIFIFQYSFFRLSFPHHIYILIHLSCYFFLLVLILVFDTIQRLDNSLYTIRLISYHRSGIFFFLIWCDRCHKKKKRYI